MALYASPNTQVTLDLPVYITQTAADASDDDFMLTDEVVHPCTFMLSASFDTLLTGCFITPGVFISLLKGDEG